MHALEALLTQWRKNRAPELADEIDRVSAELTAKEQPIKGKQAWWAALDARRPELLERLLEVAPSGLDRVDRLEAIGRLLADPRVGTFARKWLEEPPVVATSRAPFFASVVKLLDHVKDVRLLPTLDALAADRSDAMRKCGLTNYKLLVAHAERLRRERPKPVSIKAGPKKKATGGADPADLYARVYANPTDDGVRAVLADLLTERGDPRGEFINLQLARAGTDKPRSTPEKKLESRWARAWLGAIEPVVLKDGVEFERGFVSRVRYAGGAKDATLRAAEWSTVTHLDVGPARGGGRRLLTSPVLKDLQHAVGLTESDLDGVMSDLGKLPWPTLGFSLAHWDRLVRTVSTRVRENKTAFAGVKKLVTANADSSEWVVDAPLITKLLTAFPALEEAELELATNVPRLVAENTRLARVTLHRGGMTVSFDRKTKSLHLEFRLIGEFQQRLATSLVKELAPGKVVITTSRSATISDGLLFIGRRSPMSLSSIRNAARKARSELVFEGIPEESADEGGAT